MNDEHSLAYEMLVELKATSKRWFIAFIVVLVLWFSTIGVFIWYVSLPVEETTSQYEQEADDFSRNFIIQGGDYNGSETDGEENNQETGG